MKEAIENSRKTSQSAFSTLQDRVTGGPAPHDCGVADLQAALLNERLKNQIR